MGGMLNGRSCDGNVDMLDLSSLEEWITIEVPNSPIRNSPTLVSFSQTEIAIFGGYGSEAPLNQISVFNTETE